MTLAHFPPTAGLLAFAHDLADQSGATILPYFRRRIGIENKAENGQFDPVTAADRAAEDIIARLVRARWPDHGMVGEELGSHGHDARLRWIVDPIDGTRAFISGSPLWGTLIGLLDGDRPLLGMMNQPYTGERFWAEAQGAGAVMRDAQGGERPIRTRSCPDLAEATFCTTDPGLFADGTEARGFQRIKAGARMTRYGGDCYIYCLLACGFVDIIVEAGLKPFDIVALIPIIEAAGGRVTTWDGGPATAGGRILATGDPRLHNQALKMLGET